MTKFSYGPVGKVGKNNAWPLNKAWWEKINIIQNNAYVCW
jgi:hypothetical protein